MSHILNYPESYETHSYFLSLFIIAFSQYYGLYQRSARQFLKVKMIKIFLLIGAGLTIKQNKDGHHLPAQTPLQKCRTNTRLQSSVRGG